VFPGEEVALVKGKGLVATARGLGKPAHGIQLASFVIPGFSKEGVEV